MEKSVIVGAGVMGTALAIHLANNGHKVNLWGTKWDQETLDSMKYKGYHPAMRYVKIPDSLNLFYEDELEAAMQDTKLVILAVLSEGISTMSQEISPYLKANQIIVNITKGIHAETLDTMTRMIEKSIESPFKKEISFVKIGGPVIASELAHGNYTEAVFASKNIEAAAYVKSLFEGPRFKGNVSSDITGVELCASFKNCYAIAMGIMQGVEADTNNAKAALMTQGTREMARIVQASGGNSDTAFGVAGVGDYYVTSQGGRNGIFGNHVGSGKSIEESLELMNYQSVEGISATKNGYKLLKNLQEEGKLNLETDTPLFSQLYEILFLNKDPHIAIGDYWEGN